MFITLSIFNQTMTNFASLYKIYPGKILYKVYFQFFFIFVFFFMKINFKLIICFRSFFVPFYCFLVLISNFWRISDLLEKFEIQEGGSLDIMTV